MANIFESKPLTELNLVELKKQEKLTKIIAYILSGIILLLLIGIGVSWYQKGAYPRSSVSMGGFALLAFLLHDKLKKLQAEIASRQ